MYKIIAYDNETKVVVLQEGIKPMIRGEVVYFTTNNMRESHILVQTLDERIIFHRLLPGGWKTKRVIATRSRLGDRYTWSFTSRADQRLWRNIKDHNYPTLE